MCVQFASYLHQINKLWSPAIKLTGHSMFAFSIHNNAHLREAILPHAEDSIKDDSPSCRSMSNQAFVVTCRLAIFSPTVNQGYFPLYTPLMYPLKV